MTVKKEILPTQWCLDMLAYEVSESAKLSLQQKKEYLKLDWNEATFPPSPLVKERLRQAVEADIVNFYPDVTAAELREKLSHYVGLDASHIQVFNGSDDALQTICMTYIAEGDNALIRQPSYTQFDTYVQSTGANFISFCGESPFSLSIDKYHQILSREKIKMVYIVNPNNPTGLMYDKSRIRELIQKYPDTLFVIDEAYFEYAQITSVELATSYDNILITRTFSKAFSLAGLRLGYVVGKPKLLDHILKIRNGKNVNVMAQIAASAALDDVAYMNRMTFEVNRTKVWLAAELMKLGLDVHKTPANFILIRVSDVQEVIRQLKDRKILVRDRSSLAQLDGYIRVTIGLAVQMERFLNAMTEIIQKEKNLVVV